MAVSPDYADSANHEEGEPAAGRDIPILHSQHGERDINWT
jgi:hypothetical protein